ncbi:MAG: hypothetical protein HC923_12945 [Myxococcales bacterium]|nr:hypothetical protein [Myxococcales bacterium]
MTDVSVDQDDFLKAWLDASSRNGTVSELALRLLIKPSTVRALAQELQSQGWRLPPLRVIRHDNRVKRGPKEHVTVRIDKRIMFQARVYAAREETSLGDMMERLMIHGFIARGGLVDPFVGAGDPERERELEATRAELEWLEEFNRKTDESGFNRFLDIERSNVLSIQDSLEEEEEET